jgi:hypothetical protein
MKLSLNKLHDNFSYFIFYTMIGLLFVSAYCDILSTQSAMPMEAFPKTKNAGRAVVL